MCVHSEGVESAMSRHFEQTRLMESGVLYSLRGNDVHADAKMIPRTSVGSRRMGEGRIYWVLCWMYVLRCVWCAFSTSSIDSTRSIF